jgi:ectoine hydroxylase-related dioxygenase (phytanoyl-CoA dioxygenase family)
MSAPSGPARPPELDELAALRPRVELAVAPDAACVAAFHAQGFTAVPRIAPDEELAWLAELYDWLFAERRGAFRGGYFDLARRYDAPGEDLLPQLLVPELRVPELRETSFWRNGRAFAATLLGVDPETLRGWGHMIRKPARVGAPLPWHQDEAYWDPAFRYRALGCWLTLDPATPESGCLRFIPGSHRGGVRVHRHVGGDPAVHGLVTDEVDETRAVAVPVAAGGAIFHHCRMLHSSGPNTSPSVRRAWANEWQLEPVPEPHPEPRPWIAEGKQAWDAREIYAR